MNLRVLRTPGGISRSGLVALHTCEKRNVILASEVLGDAAWDTVGNHSITANQAAAPDGNTTADLVTVTDPDSYFFQTHNRGAALVGKTYTFTAWVKGGGTKATVHVRMLNNSDGTDQATSLVTLTSSWQRITVSRTFTGAGNQIWAGFDNRAGAGGDGLTGTFYAWGAQLYEGSHYREYEATTDNATAADTSGAGNDLTLSGAIWRYPGIFFDGVNDSVTGLPALGAAYTVINASDSQSEGVDSDGGSFINGVATGGAVNYDVGNAGGYSGILTYRLQYNRVLRAEEHKRIHYTLRKVLGGRSVVLP